MWIVRLALRRPYTFVVAALVLLLLTPMVLLRMPTDMLPSIEIPVITAVWEYGGLNSQEIEQRIVFLHERMISTLVDNIEHMESTSYNGFGVIKVFLRPGASVPVGVAQVTATAQAVLRFMPPNITPPIIIRYDASTVPILQYSFASKKLSEPELQDLAMNRVRVDLAGVEGAAIPTPYGGKVRVVSVDLDLGALKAWNLAPEDVIKAMNVQNFILPSGTAKIGSTEYDVTLNSNPLNLNDLNNIPIKSVDGTVIHVRDVALVHDGYKPQTNIVRLNGVRGVLLTVFKSGAASTLKVVEEVRNAMPRILAGLPPEMEGKEFADQSVFVRAAVNAVLVEGVIAAALTATMILLFLGAWRSTLIIAISIPLSMLVSITALWSLGETLNLMTLGGLALAVGILVDDATVTIENIHLHMESGKTTIEAILDGAREIAVPTFVATLCICIVFVPMFFLTGTAPYLFVPLAEAVVFAMLASYVLSRTLVPTLVMWFYRHASHGDQAQPARPAALWLRPFTAIHMGFQSGFNRFREGYRGWLRTVLHYRLPFMAVFLLFCLGSLSLTPYLGQNFFPNVDAGQFRLHLRARSGTRIEETAKLVDQVEAEIRQEIPANEVAGILDNIGPPNAPMPMAYIDNGVVGTGDADILVSLRPGHQPTEEYVRRLRMRLTHSFPGVVFYFLPADIVSQTINFGLPAPFDIQFVGRDQKGNRAAAGRLADELRHVPGVADVRVQQPGDLPRLEWAVDRIRAAEIGVTERDVADSVLLSLSGSSQAKRVYWLNQKNGVQYLVDIRVPQREIDSLNTLHSIPVSIGRKGESDPQVLTNVATFRRSTSPPIVSHYNVKPVIDVLAGVNSRDLGGVLRDIRPLVAEAEKGLSKGNYIIMRGQAETMNSSYVGLGIGLVMSVALVYLLLVVNFQSWLDPFIILTALPGALAGVVWGLFITQTTLSVPALMGAIMSLGVATANSVLVVSFARDNLRKGIDPLNAVWEAGVGRLRPVLMTALAMIIGMLPMALGHGEGAEQNAPLGRAVIGGLCVATFATLFFVPVVFRLMHRRAYVEGSDNIDAMLS
ncbi:MAG: efflux RND transporter permease subunit [Pirellulaceae bacterium]|nr:efflux RND transporter permease subunit [Pirellulaceae bacterium]